MISDGAGKMLSSRFWLISWLILLLLITAGGWFVTGYLGDKARQEIIEYNESNISLHSYHLTSEFDKIERAVKLLSGSPWIAPALISRKEQDIANAHLILDRYNAGLGSSVSYLLDSTGMTVASSNRDDSDSFVSKSYKFRPYFTQAVKGSHGRYFALGATSLKRGFYASYPVRDGKGLFIGVAVIKLDVDAEESHLVKYPYCFVIDPNGVIFLSGRKEMNFKSLWPVSGEIKSALLKSKQFGEKEFDSILQKEIEDGKEITLYGKNYLASRKWINSEGWSIILMTTTERILIYRLAGVIITILICVFILVPLIINYKMSKAAEKVRESERKYRNILENIEDGYFEVDTGGNLTFFNDSTCRIIGYSANELMGMNYRAFTDDVYAKKIFGVFNEVYKTGVPAKAFDWELIRKDGLIRFVETVISLTTGSDKVKTGFRGIVRDITERKHSEVELNNSFLRLRAALGGTIQALAVTVETRDPYTAGHQRRVADLSRAIAKEMGLESNRIDGIRMAGIIHDIGKLMVPSETLSKPSILSDIEYRLIKIHPLAGFNILKDIEFPWPIANIVLQHHERLNGSGYPSGLKGEEILLEARIIAVADVVEAIGSNRPYRPARGIGSALEEIRKNSGILYDDAAVDACLRLFLEKGYQLV
ncbi:MAG: Histidine kinase [Thermodesulfobacteriota bacterium]|nr:Histidine kinase [Thermodesulfobacteriota bacterium]